LSFAPVAFIQLPIRFFPIGRKSYIAVKSLISSVKNIFRKLLSRSPRRRLTKVRAAENREFALLSLADR
jgi:hypothetical protein